MHLFQYNNYMISNSYENNLKPRKPWNTKSVIIHKVSHFLQTAISHGGSNDMKGKLILTERRG